MGCSQFHPLQLLVFYCALLLLGILFEVDLPFSRGLYDKKLEDIVLQVQQKGAMQLGRDSGRKLMTSYLRSLESKEFERPYQSVSKSVSLSKSEYNKNTDLRNLLKRKNKIKDNLTIENFDSHPSAHYNQKRTLKLSSELNAFDEIVQLLTVPTTFCAELVSSFAVNSSPVPFYHCSVRNLGRCFTSNSGYGHYSYQFSQNCFKSKKIAGYDVSPAKLLPNMDRNSRVHSMGAGDNRKGIVDEIKAQKINVDNSYIFVEEFKDLKYMPVIRLDLKLNLAGLNSLHKYEVLSKLLKVIRWVLNKQGYHLERSSADGHLLHDYLHQEGVQQPLYIYTIWHLYSGRSSLQ
ncbi:uncharacterized protein [Macrobrachium rosenbergii]|uniref:uncharacterized protein n=1 Tax=Macrobrachium rosenbergii TaxID=79674 RepID=UPI0034D78B5A